MTLALNRHAQQKPFLGYQIDRAHALTQDMACGYLMVEGAGAAFYDSVGQKGAGNTSTGTGTALSWSTGRFGPCLAVTATNGFGSIPLPFTSGTTPAQYTMAGWVYLTGNAGWIWGSRASSADKFFYVSGGKLGFGISSGVGAASPTVTFSFNAWHHIACTKINVSGTPTYALYQDGVLVGSGTNALDAAWSNSFVLGSDANLSHFGNMNGGYIDGIFVWSRALTAPEVGQLYAEPFAMIQQPTYRRWFVVAGGTAYSRTLSISVAHTAAVSRAQALSRLSSVSMAPTAALARSQTLTRVQSSSVSPTAAVARTLAFTRAQSSTVAPTAAVARQLTLVRAQSSTITQTSALAGLKVILRALSSTIAPTAVVDRTLAFTRAQSSTVAPTGALARTVGFARALASSVTHTAALLGLKVILRALASTIAPTAVLARSQTLSRALASTVAHTGALARTVGFARARTSSVAHSSAVARSASLVRALSSTRAPVAAVARALTLTRALSVSRAHSAAVTGVRASALVFSLGARFVARALVALFRGLVVMTLWRARQQGDAGMTAIPVGTDPAVIKPQSINRPVSLDLTVALQTGETLASAVITAVDSFAGNQSVDVTSSWVLGHSIVGAVVEILVGNANSVADHTYVITVVYTTNTGRVDEETILLPCVAQ